MSLPEICHGNISVIYWTYLLIYLFIRSFIHSFIHSFTHSFIQNNSLIHLMTLCVAQNMPSNGTNKWNNYLERTIWFKLHF